MNKIEHLGIAVRNLREAEAVFERLLGAGPYKRETVESERVTTSFFRMGESKVELLEATDPQSVIARYLERRGEGLHHVAFAVGDIRAEMQRLKQAGFTLLSDEPRAGADNKWVCFVHPKDCNGVLVELCQDRD
ncbi:MAG: methylmalonyl-CoA epimerase [Chitinophagales bacterium]|nr:methylmalonyl-CoA epimerase [Chitinophagales bacterium]